MGARQSHLNIFLKNKFDTYSAEGYEVTVSQDVVAESPNFDVVTHKIKYKNGNATSFDIYIYNTFKTEHNASYIFAYCSPKDHQVAYQVKAYYSILVPQVPLVISFVNKTEHIYHCDIKKLINDEWNWAYRISEYHVEMPKQLNIAFERILWNKTIGFVSDKTTKDVIVFPRKIDNKNYRLIFIPYEVNAFLNSDCLFTFDTKLIRDKEHLVVQRGCQKTDNRNNKIDPYFLKTVYKQFYHGVLVYFAKDDVQTVTLKEEHDKNTALLVEFISTDSKIHIKRKDKKGTYWAQEKIEYTSYAMLGKTLSELKDSLNSKDINTFIIDKNESYIGVSSVAPEPKKSFNKYTHSFNESKDSVIVFNRTTTDFGPLKATGTKAKSIEVYYLKVTVKGEKVDSKPFVIVVDVDGVVKNKKAYHFGDQDDFKKWVEFAFTEKGQKLTDENLITKLYQRLDLIDKSGSCSGELQLLQQLAHRILTKDDYLDPVKPTEVPPEERPQPYPPPAPPPEEPNWLLIIGSSVGAFVFVCLLAIAYGIYWYNTTIKLLT